MKYIWSKFQFISALLVISTTLFVACDWVATGEQRRIQKRLVGVADVDAIQFTYYDGSTLDLHIWTRRNGYLIGAGISAKELISPGKGALAQIGDFRISCEIPGNEGQTRLESDNSIASIFEIGVVLNGDPNLTFIQLITEYDPVYEKIQKLSIDFPEGQTYSVSKEKYLAIFPDAKLSDDQPSVDFVCRSLKVDGFVAPLKPGVKLRSPEVWFYRKSAESLGRANPPL